MRKAHPSCCVRTSSSSAGTLPLLQSALPKWDAGGRQPAKMLSCLASDLPPTQQRPPHPTLVERFSTSVFPGTGGELNRTVSCVSHLGSQYLPAWAGEMLKDEQEVSNCSVVLAANVSSAPLRSKGSNTVRITRRIFLHFVSLFFFFLSFFFSFFFSHPTVYCLICSTRRLIEEILCSW